MVLPSNYIPWGGPGPEERRNELYRQAGVKIDEAASAILERRKGPVEKGPLWQRLLFTAIYRMSFKQVPKMDKDFWVDDRCNSCAICVRVCPAGNITLAAGRPVWQHHCEQCLACIQWCPETAIQFGKKTPGYERYHHPDVQLKDMID